MLLQGRRFDDSVFRLNDEGCSHQQHFVKLPVLLPLYEISETIFFVIVKKR